MTDLSTLSTNEGTFRVELRHPRTADVLLRDDDNEPMWVDVYGEHSEILKKTDRMITDRNIKRAQGRRTMSLTAEQLEAQAMERLVAAVHSWNIVIDGDTPEVKPQVVREILDAYPWIAGQIEAAVTDNTNFIKS